MVGKEVWKKGLMVLALIVAAGVFYAISRLEEASQGAGGALVFSPQFMPVTGGRLAPAPEPQSEAAGAPAPAPPVGVDPLGEPVPLVPVVSSGAERPARQGFGPFRIARAEGRSLRLEAIDEALAAPDLSAAERERLQSEKLRLIELEEMELRAEGLLVARGLADAIVALGEGSAEVIVPGALSREEAGQVGDLVARVSGVKLDRIIIVDGALLE